MTVVHGDQFVLYIKAINRPSVIGNKIRIEYLSIEKCPRSQ